ncbi:MAG TPA: hypothetical protein VN158_01635 [Caulobacter sp.]|nr:hypothetical protein [Caulobacter sp.]
MFEAFSKVLGKGQGEVFVDRAQILVVVGKRLFETHDAAGGPGKCSWANDQATKTNVGFQVE